MEKEKIQKIAKKIETPCFIIDEQAIESNLKILDEIQKKAGCKILLALKGFAMFSVFPLIKKYLAGVCAGSLNEIKLGREFGKEIHSYFPAFKEEEFPEILESSDHIIFNSFQQFEKYKKQIKNKKIGLRINPQVKLETTRYAAYDPCSENSRLGVKLSELKEKDLNGISGLHFHVLCEQDASDLENVLIKFDEFSEYIKKMSWVNFGGGHHITRKDYDTNKLIQLIKDFRKKYPNIKDIYLEPGEAVVLNAGCLVSSVLDIIKRKKQIAILDTSVETHIPDVMITRNEKIPYVPDVLGAGKPGEFNYNYILAGTSCAAGDVISEYSFQKPLKEKDKIIFLDVAHYTMVKTSTFCGVNLPSIYFLEKSGNLKLIRKFSYEDYKIRLG